MEIETCRTNFFLASQTMSELTGFTAPAPSTDQPTGIIPIGAGNFNKLAANLIEIVLVGVGSAAQTVTALAVGWKFNLETGLYIPRELARLTGTLGATAVEIPSDAPVLGGLAINFAETIDVAAGEGLDGTALISSVKISQGGIASVVLDALGSQFIQVITTNNDSSTSANAFITGL